jgi:hypothetical protein
VIDSRCCIVPLCSAEPSIEYKNVEADSSGNPEINRLRAAAALIPIIESGLADSKFSVERAELMASFCEWAIEKVPDDPEVVKMAETVGNGLERIRIALAPVG